MKKTTTQAITAAHTWVNEVIYDQKNIISIV